MSTHVHEFQQVIWVKTSLGEGVLVLHIDYGPQHNGTFMVILEDGQVRYFDAAQVRVLKNNTMEIGA